MDNGERDRIVEIVIRLKSGDQQAFETLYKYTHNRVFFLALKVLHNHNDALEVVQETYVSVYKYIGKLYKPEAFSAWLSKIVINKCKDYLGKQKEVLMTENEEVDGRDTDEVIEDTTADFIPHEMLDKSETRSMIMALIDALPDSQRMTILLHYYQALSVEEIAAIMECPASTVKSRLLYAKRQIKAGVEDYEAKGVRLYSIAIVPVVIYLLEETAKASALPPATATALFLSVSQGLYTIAATAGVHAAIGVSKASLFGKIIALSIKTKLIAGIIAAVILTAAVVTPIALNASHSIPSNAANTQVVVSLAVQSEPPRSTSASTAKEWETAYAPVLDKYREFAVNFSQSGGDSDSFSDWSGPWYGMACDIVAEMPAFGYAFRDMDGNGVPELFLLTDDGYIRAMYTYVDGAPKLLGWYASRNACYLNRTDEIYTSWSEGAADWGDDAYRISKDGRELEFVERVGEESMDENGNTLDAERYYKCVGSEMNKKIISKKEAETEWAKFPRDNDNSELEFIPIMQGQASTAPESQEPEVINTIGNTMGNISNEGIAAQHGGWIYYDKFDRGSTNGALYKIRTDGTSKTKLNSSGSEYINVVGDWIYYRNVSDNRYIYKIRTDGTGETRLNNEESSDINVIGDWIYYVSSSDDSDNRYIYKIRTDGTDEIKLNSDDSGWVNVVDDWIYYNNQSDNGYLYKIRTDGTERTKLNNEHTASPIVVEGWIYYRNYALDYLYKIRTDGTEHTKLLDFNIFDFNVSGDWIYYESGNEDDNFALCKIRTDGTENYKLNSEESCAISVVGDWIFYSAIDANGINTLYKIRTDGTDRQKVN
jgi:RNA polymerase sigma factor (sigma-70 family)